MDNQKYEIRDKQIIDNLLLNNDPQNKSILLDYLTT